MIILPSLEIVPAKYNTSTNTLLSQIPIDGTGDFTVSRTTSPVTNQSTRVNALGQIELVADNVPRLDYPIGGGCPALLVEPAATNSIRNNSMVGAVAGSPGTLPTNFTEFTQAGLSREIVATGTESGIPYIDYRIFGNANSNATRFLAFESTTQIVASSGQRWTNSVYAKVVSAPNPPSQYSLYIVERNASGGSITSQVANISIGSSLTRFELNSAPLGATTERVQPTIAFLVSNAQSYDFTIRIGYPQMELGSVATSVIPTTTQAIARAADVITDTTASGVIGQTEGTIYAEVVLSNNSAGSIFLLDNGSTSTFLNIVRNTAQNIQVTLRNGGGTIATIITSSALANGVHKIALSYTNGAYSLYINGSPAGTSTNSTDYPASLTRASISTSDYGAPYFPRNDRIRAAALYPTRLTDTQLALLTSPYTSYSSMASALSYTLG